MAGAAIGKTCEFDCHGWLGLSPWKANTIFLPRGLFHRFARRLKDDENRSDLGPEHSGCRGSNSTMGTPQSGLRHVFCLEANSLHEDA